MAQKRKHTESEAGPVPGTPQLFTSTSIHDRASTFKAIFTPVTEQPTSFQQHPPFATASHKILAWRKHSTQTAITKSFASSRISYGTGSSPADSTIPVPGPTRQKIIFTTGSDDDGEKWAGKRLEELLTELKVEGTVVVARWYGGVMLGPVRFKWIKDCAREAVEMWKAQHDESGNSSSQKKAKLADGSQAEDVEMTEEEVQRRKARLVRVLGERDTSVEVLRDMLLGKNRELEAMQEALVASAVKADVVSKPPVTKVKYDILPLDALKRLEKARDASIGWILKQIDEMEVKIMDRSREIKRQNEALSSSQRNHSHQETEDMKAPADSGITKQGDG